MVRGRCTLGAAGRECPDRNGDGLADLEPLACCLGFERCPFFIGGVEPDYTLGHVGTLLLADVYSVAQMLTDVKVDQANPED